MSVICLYAIIITLGLTDTPTAITSGYVSIETVVTMRGVTSNRGVGQSTEPPTVGMTLPSAGRVDQTTVVRSTTRLPTGKLL